MAIRYRGGKMLQAWLRTLGRLRIESPVYATGATVAAVLGFALSGFAQNLEHWSTDLQTAYLSDRRPSQHPRIALVVVNEETLRDHPYTSPVDRAVIAELLEQLESAGAKIIGLDFIFDRPTESAKDSKLIDSIRRAKSQIVLAALDSRSAMPEASRGFQADLLAKTGRPFGHSYFDENHNPLALSDQTIRLMAAASPDDPQRRGFAEVLAAIDGQNTRPDTPVISWLLPPRNGSETFLTLSAEQVLGREASVSLPLKDLFRDRIVIVGGNFPDRDQHLTPLSVATSERYSGLSIHAQILAQLLDRRSIHWLSWPVEILILTVVACGGIWFGRRDRFGHHHLWIKTGSIAGLIVVSAMTFASLGVIFPITFTLLFLLAGMAFGYHSKRFIG